MRLQTTAVELSGHRKSSRRLVVLEKDHSRLLNYATILYAAMISGGGATIDPKTGLLLGPGFGYVVALAPYGRRFTRPPTRSDIFGWLLDVHDVLKSCRKRLFIGIWTNPLSGAVWVDLNLILQSKANAVRLGVRERQEFIFSRHEDVSMPLSLPGRRAA